jgi:hypothetical protein
LKNELKITNKNHQEWLEIKNFETIHLIFPNNNAKLKIFFYRMNRVFKKIIKEQIINIS